LSQDAGDALGKEPMNQAEKRVHWQYSEQRPLTQEKGKKTIQQ
jgi:hypothetical protein